MVGGDNHSPVGLCQPFEQFRDDGMSEPAECDRTVGRLIVSQLPHHLRLCACMAQHIDEVEHHHIEIILLQLVKLLHEAFCAVGVVDFVIGEGIVTTVSLQLRLYEWSLVEILSLFLILIHPQVGEHARHKSREDGVTGILRGCGEDTEIELFLDIEAITYLIGYHSPLVVSEIVKHQEEHLLTIVDGWKDLTFKHLGTQHRSMFCVTARP